MDSSATAIQLLFGFFIFSFFRKGNSAWGGKKEKLLLFRQQGGGEQSNTIFIQQKKAFPPYPHLVAAVFFLSPFFIPDPLSS